MEKFRSMSCREGRIQLESNYKNGYPTSMEDLRSYSTSYASDHSAAYGYGQLGIKEEAVKVKKSKSSRVNNDASSTANYNNNNSKSSSSSSWRFSDPELQRKKRVASYKVYAVEGKMKGSLRKSFRWIKNTCSHSVFGWW
ncbi:hypothetical protein Ancab_012552 [Ancistrocladus abbreviatus]